MRVLRVKACTNLKPRGNTAPHTVSPNRARSRGRKPAAAHTRSRAGIGARKPAAAHSQPAGRAGDAMAGRRWRRRRHRTCAPTRPMARPPLGTQKTHSTPSSVTTVSSTGSFRRVATNAPRAARVGYLSQARAGHRPSRSSQPPSCREPSAYTRRPCPSATREAGVHVHARSRRTRRRAPSSECRARTERLAPTGPLARHRSHPAAAQNEAPLALILVEHIGGGRRVQLAPPVPLTVHPGALVNLGLESSYVYAPLVSVIRSCAVLGIEFDAEVELRLLDRSQVGHLDARRLAVLRDRVRLGAVIADARYTRVNE